MIFSRVEESVRLGPNCFESHFPVAKMWRTVHGATRYGGAGCSLCVVAQLGCLANSRGWGHLFFTAQGYLTNCKLLLYTTVSTTQRTPKGKARRYHFYAGSVPKSRLAFGHCRFKEPYSIPSLLSLCLPLLQCWLTDAPHGQPCLLCL